MELLHEDISDFKTDTLAADPFIDSESTFDYQEITNQWLHFSNEVNWNYIGCILELVTAFNLVECHNAYEQFVKGFGNIIIIKTKARAGHFLLFSAKLLTLLQKKENVFSLRFPRFLIAQHKCSRV